MFVGNIVWIQEHVLVGSIKMWASRLELVWKELLLMMDVYTSWVEVNFILIGRLAETFIEHGTGWTEQRTSIKRHKTTSSKQGKLEGGLISRLGREGVYIRVGGRKAYIRVGGEAYNRVNLFGL